jgi:hypothetical protein
MSSRLTIFWLWLGALVVRAALALPQQQPGYMDASYYYHVAVNLTQGKGFSENFIWNYLAQPTQLPTPSNAHWMPLTSLVIAPFLYFLGDSYRAAQLPMVVLASFLVPLTYLLSLQLFQQTRWALTAALLMLASSFYLPFWGASDSFALYALIGTALLWLTATIQSSPPTSHSPTANRQPAFCGMLVALAHLTRADGFLLAMPLVFVAWRTRRYRLLAMVALGYGVVMTPWFARNLLVFGTLLVGGNAVFLRSYDDLFSYEKALTLAYWLEGGIAPIVTAQLRALLLNVATLLGALQFVFLPCALIALWRDHARPIAQATWVYLLTLLWVMSCVFSLPGPRGTFLHSLSALLPILYAFAPYGLSRSVQWIAQRRATWNAAQAERVFGVAFVCMAIALSAMFYVNQFVTNAEQIGWNQRFAIYREVNAWLVKATGDATSPVLCINPPAFYYFTQRAALAIPTDDRLAVIRAATQFQARYLILEKDRPHPLDPVYEFAIPPDPRFRLLATFTDADGSQVQLHEVMHQR